MSNLPDLFAPDPPPVNPPVAEPEWLGKPPRVVDSGAVLAVLGAVVVLVWAAAALLSWAIEG